MSKSEFLFIMAVTWSRLTGGLVRKICICILILICICIWISICICIWICIWICIGIWICICISKTLQSPGAEWQEGLFARCPRLASGGVLSKGCQTPWKIDRGIDFFHPFGCDHIPSTHLSNLVLVYWYQEILVKTLLLFFSTHLSKMSPTLSLLVSHAGWVDFTFRALLSNKSYANVSNPGWLRIIGWKTHLERKDLLDPYEMGPRWSSIRASTYGKAQTQGVSLDFHLEELLIKTRLGG